MRHVAFDAQGFWKPEDDNTANAVNAVIASGSPLMKQARGLGMAVANKRGLANSSIAAGTATSEMMKAATPIGLQQSAQTSQKNLQFQSDVAAKDRVGMQIASNEKISANEIAGRMAELNARIDGDLRLAKQGDEAAMARLQKDLASRETLARMDVDSRTALAKQDADAAMARLQADLGSREKISGQELSTRMAELTTRINADKELAARGDAAAMARLQADIAGRTILQQQSDTATLLRQREELANRTDISAADRTARMAELDKQLTSQANLAQMDAAARQKLVETEGRQAMDRSVLDANTRLDIADKESQLAAQRYALDAATNATNAYMSALGQSMLNENIPADVRASFQASLQKTTQANIALVNQITGQNLTWGTMSSTTPTGGVPTSPPPPMPATSGATWPGAPLPAGVGTTITGKGTEYIQTPDGRILTYVNGTATGLYNPSTGNTTPFGSDSGYATTDQYGNWMLNPNWNGNLR